VARERDVNVQRSFRRLATTSALTLALAASSLAPVGADPTLEPVAGDFGGILGFSVSQNGTFYIADVFAEVDWDTFETEGALVGLEPNGTRTTLATGQLGGGVVAQGNDVTFTEALAPELGEQPEQTTLRRWRPSGALTTVASLSDVEATNPDQVNTYGWAEGTPATCVEISEDLYVSAEPYPGEEFSNPYAVAVDGSDRIVADAGANTLVRVRPDGATSVIAVFPPVAQTFTEGVVEALLEEYEIDASACLGATYRGEFVPTDVEVGPDGHYYVTSLPGSPELPGEGSVWRVHRRTGALTPIVDGLVGPTDLAIARDGTIYVAELFGFSVAVVRDGSIVDRIEVEGPTAVEIHRRGNRETLYVAHGLPWFGTPSGISRLHP
jgi:hypothetical protein